MIKLFFGSSPEIVKRLAKKEIKKDFPHQDESNFVSFNMAVTPLKELAEECSFLSLGTEKKCVLAYDCAFLGESKTKPKFAKDDDPNALLDYLLNPIFETDLYLLVYNGALAKKSDFIDAIKKNGYIKECLVPETKEWIAYAERYLGGRGVKIEQKAAAELVRRVNGDFGVFLNELAKLEAYSAGEPIRVEAVANLVTKLEEDDAFAIGNALIRGNNGAAIEAYRKAKKNGADEVRLINMLSSQLLYLDQVRFLDEMGFDSVAISRQLGGSPKRAEIAQNNLYYLRRGALEEALEGLYQCQRSILRGEVAPDYAFSLFLTRLQMR
ncbi:MAG: DNA polymerase III subunit delta [Bacilli bacterium]|nr:DNA polymerase III subunit delta [Bacilli bacterium]